MPKFLLKVDHVMDKLEENIAGYAMLAVAVILFVNVVLRNFFHSGLVWGNELSSYLNILAVFMAGSAGFKYGTHVGVSAFVDFVVPKKLRRFAALLTQLCILGFTVLVFVLGIQMAMRQFAQHQVSPVLQVPIGLVYLFATAGMLGSAIRTVMQIVKLYYKGDSASTESGKEGN